MTDQGMKILQLASVVKLINVEELNDEQLKAVRDTMRDGFFECMEELQRRSIK